MSWPFWVKAFVFDFGRCICQYLLASFTTQREGSLPERSFFPLLASGPAAAMAATPSFDETKAMKTDGAVFAWLPMPEALQQAALEAFDMKVNEPVRNFVAVPDQLFETT